MTDLEVDSGAADPAFGGDTLIGGDLRLRSARASAASVFAQALRFILGFGSTIVLARLLVPGDFGVVAMVVAITGFVALFRELGLALATVQAPSISGREVTTLFWINSAVGALLMGLTLAIAPAIAWFYGDARLTAVALALAPPALLSGLACQHRALLRRELRFGALAIIDVIAFAVGIGVALVAAARGAGYWALVLIPLVTDLIALLGVWILCPWRPGPPARLEEVRRLLAFGGNITGFDFVNYWARNSDNVLLGRFWGPHQLGLYSRAYQILMLPIELVAGPIGAVAISALSRVAAVAPQHYRLAALGIVQKIALVTMPAAVLMLTGADWLIAVLLGPQWGEAAPIVAVLGLAAFTQPVGHAAGWLLITQDRTADLFRWGLIGGALAVASIVLGLRWGAFGVAASYAIVGLVVRTPLLLWFVGRRGPILAIDYARSMAIPAAGALAGLVAAVAFRRLVGPVAPLPGLVGLVALVLLAGVATVSLVPGGRLLLREMVGLCTLVLSRARGAS